MDSVGECDKPESVRCDGPCGKLIHESRVDRPNFRFCDDCRLDFVPALKRRDAVMADAIQQLSGRIDSVDATLRSLVAALKIKMTNDQSSQTDNPAELPGPRGARRRRRHEAKYLSMSRHSKGGSPESTRSDSITPVATAEVGPELPTEVWEQVFDLLSNEELLGARQVCRRWKSIVNGSSQLLNKLELKFPEDIIMDGEYAPRHLFPARRVVLTNVTILTTDFWWSKSFGENLSVLTITEGSFSLPTLLAMLRQTPNLKRFELKKSLSSFDTVPRTKFRLEKMEHLTLETVDHAQSIILDAFKWIFPRLKSFKLLHKYYERKVIGFIQALQNTLQSIDLPPKHNLLVRIAQLERLRLKRLAFGLYGLSNFDEQQLVEASRLQPQIECLNMHSIVLVKSPCMEALREICSNLPSLKRLAIAIWRQPRKETLIPTFLDVTPELEFLAITSANHEIDFSGFKNKTLKELFLGHIYPVGNSLQKYLEHCPNLHILTLSNLNRHRELEECEQLRLTHRWDAPKEPQLLDSLKILNLETCNIPPETLRVFLSACPLVQEAHLRQHREFDVEQVAMVCQSLKSLLVLTLSHLNDTMVEHISNHCHVLRKLVAYDSEELSNDAAERLRDDIDVKLYFKTACNYFDINC